MSEELGGAAGQVQKDGNTVLLAGVETAFIVAKAIKDHLDNQPKAVKITTKSSSTTVAQDLDATRSMLRQGMSKQEIATEIQKGTSYQRQKAKGLGDQYMNDLFTSAERKNAANLENRKGQTQTQKKSRRNTLS